MKQWQKEQDQVQASDKCITLLWGLQAALPRHALISRGANKAFMRNYACLLSLSNEIDTYPGAHLASDLHCCLDVIFLYTRVCGCLHTVSMQGLCSALSGHGSAGCGLHPFHVVSCHAG